MSLKHSYKGITIDTDKCGCISPDDFHGKLSGEHQVVLLIFMIFLFMQPRLIFGSRAREEEYGLGYLSHSLSLSQ